MKDEGITTGMSRNISVKGSGIRRFIDTWIRDGKKILIRIRDEHSTSYFWS
jgi:hypothetical protein